MSIGAIFGEAWQVYKSGWRLLATISLIIFLVTAGPIALAVNAGSVAGIVVTTLFGLLGQFWLQGALVKAIAEIRAGRRDLTIGQTLAQVRPYVGRIAAASLLAGLGMAVGLLLLIVPGLILMTLWIFVIPVIVIENSKVRDSFDRSTQLVKGYGWNIFGMIVVTLLVSLVFGLLLGVLVAGLDDGARRFIADLVSGTLVAPFTTTAWTIAYFTVRGLKGELAQDPAQPQIH